MSERDDWISLKDIPFTCFRGNSINEKLDGPRPEIEPDASISPNPVG